METREIQVPDPKNSLHPKPRRNVNPDQDRSSGISGTLVVSLLGNLITMLGATNRLVRIRFRSKP